MLSSTICYFQYIVLLLTPFVLVSSPIKLVIIEYSSDVHSNFIKNVSTNGLVAGVVVICTILSAEFYLIMNW